MFDLFPKDCDESQELVSTCGAYCFKSIRYILDHTKFLQQHYDERQQMTETSTEKVLRELQQELQKQGQRLEDVVAKLRIPTATATVTATALSTTTPFRKIGNKYYYIEEKQKLNWFGAHHYCLSLGAHLASVHSQSEIDALVRESKNYFYWLDINDLGTECEFLSSTTGKEPVYVNWAPNEPNNAMGNEDCVILAALNSNNNMNDEVCEKVTNFICEKDFSE